MVLRYPSRVLAILGLLAALVAGLPVRLAGAADAVVNAPCTDTEFSNALNQVQNTGGGTITFNCGGPATVELQSEKTITSNVRIEGGEEITLSGNDNGIRLFWVNQGATLELDGLILENGQAEDGGAIYNDGGTVTISDTDFYENFANNNGGAIYNDGGAVTISDSYFEINEAEDGGAIYNGEDSILSITDAGFDFNFAYDNGGAIENDGELTIDGSDFYENEADDGFGGAINDDGGPAITITDTWFENNYAWLDSGAIDSEADSLTIIDSHFAYNFTNDGYAGAIWTSSETTISESSFESNSSYWDGGAIYSVAENLTIDRTTFSDNYAEEDGGAVYLAGGTVTILRSTFEDNASEFDDGGAIYAGGDSLESESVTLQGIEVGQPTMLTIDRSTFSGNYADDEGGAIFVTEAATVDIANTTIYDNEADDEGGGIYNDFGVVTLFNTIIADNFYDDCDGDFTSNGYNLDSDDTCELDQPTDLPDTDPMLADLGWYGGDIETHLPLEGSPVIDAGPATCTSPDQRGQPAPLGNACDIGAVELGVVADTAQGSSDGTICISRVNGQVYYPKADGSCGSRMLYAFDITENEPVLLCINNVTGVVSLGQDDCSRYERPHVLPDDFSLLTCTNRVTGVVRGVTDVGECSRYELPGAIVVEAEPEIDF